MQHAPPQKMTPLSSAQEPRDQSRKHPRTFWQSILTAMERKVGRQVPLILQMNAVECGAACLAMMLGYYGCKTSIAELRDRSGVGRDGLSAYHIVQLARVYGLRVRAVSLSSRDLGYVRWPAIVHWQFNHFLLVERWSEHFVDIVDPAAGRKRLTVEEFNSDFTGIVIMLELGEDFVRSRTRPRITLRTYVAQYIKQFPAILWQIIAVSLILQVFGLLVPLLTKVVVDQIIPFRMGSILLPLGLGILILLFAQLVTMFLRASLLTYLQARMDTAVSSAFFEHLLKLSPRFFQLRSSGDLLNRAASNTIIRDLISSQLVSTLLDGSLVVVYMLILFSQSLVFGCTVLLTGLLQVVLLLASYRSVRLLTGRELEAEGKAQGYVAEMLTGMETLKAAGAEQHAFQQWSNLFFEQLNIALRRDYLTAAISTCIITLSALSPLLFLLIGAADVLNGSMQLGTMLALNALAGAFLAPLAALVQSGQQLQTINSHLQRISDVMEAEPEQDLSTVQQPHRLSGHITLEHVSFQYDAQGPKVLDDIVLKIKPGQKVALVGRSGSGKTTLGKLLLGLYLPTEGQITYDDVSLNALDYQAVRAQFGAVMQDAHIFSGTIRQNIAFNNPAMDMERIMKAAQLAELHADISQWPLGYETFVAEGGRALSGGQCQRLALARALANEPAILLLDEATSALDVVTECTIEQNLQSLSCTQIIIAHRLSTIQHADTILVLDQGKIVERGSHTQLLAQHGYYARLIHNQLQSANSNDS